jgi:hypothetical protein
MDDWGTILLGWAAALVVPAVYAAWILVRARVLARQLHLGEAAGGDPMAADAGVGHGGTPRT